MLSWSVLTASDGPIRVAVIEVAVAGNVLRPGSRLLVTTHGAHYLPRLDAAERARFEAGELVVRWEEAAGSNLCAAYHPRSYVERTLLRPGFALAEFVEEGAKGNPAQDLYLLRKR